MRTLLTLIRKTARRNLNLFIYAFRLAQRITKQQMLQNITASDHVKYHQNDTKVISIKSHAIIFCKQFILIPS